MGMPASRLTDAHLCPWHGGGPVSGPCAPNVLIGGLLAARITDLCVCIGPPDMIAMGSFTVFTAGLPQARIGDPTAHGGALVMGMPTVLVG
jgi:uncharacterized Zn-binding protein involved in type VI secretion